MKKLTFILFTLLVNYSFAQKSRTISSPNLKEKSTTKEIDISKDLYKKFSNFRTSLFENLVKNNINHDKAILLRFTQKLCDRIIFILFINLLNFP